MKRLLALLAFLLILPTAALAQSGALVVATCGTLPQSYKTGATRPLVVDVNGNICISGSISASTSGFAPGGNYGTLTSTVASADAALPSGAVVTAWNTGTSSVSCVLGIGAQTATANKNIIPSGGSWFAFTVGSNTHIACINQAGDVASNVVVLSGGTGLPTGSGGGGGGSGGNVNVTQFGSSNVVTGTGTSGAGIPRVTVSSDSSMTANQGTAGASPWLASVNQGGNTAVVKQANTVAATDQALAVAVANATAPGQATMAASQPVVIASNQSNIPVVNGATTYQAVAASQTATVLQTSAGATGDYLSHCIIYPTSTSPGVVTVFDNTNTAANSAVLFPGGASSTSNLTPISVPVGAKSVNGAWKVTTGANVSVVCVGKFS